jgi:[ribosomal protein S5]-alanine N-acetyltransferase
MSRVSPPGKPGSVCGWRKGLPELTGSMATVRDIRTDDAASLYAMMATDDVGRFISTPPTSLEGFERFIMMMHVKRDEGHYACFAIEPIELGIAVGLIQLRAAESGFGLAEWGFAIGAPFWGTGLFPDAARLVMEFAFNTLGVHRLEARAAVFNARGNRALHKVGATCEGVLRSSLRKDGEVFDQNLWAILAADWRGAHWNGNGNGNGHNGNGHNKRL